MVGININRRNFVVGINDNRRNTAHGIKVNWRNMTAGIGVCGRNMTVAIILRWNCGSIDHIREMSASRDFMSESDWIGSSLS